MLETLLKRWAAFCEQRNRVEYISGHGHEDVYLVRYHLINWPAFKLYLHIFLRSDRDDPHDHPWDFWTFMVRGQYSEEVYDWRTREFKRNDRSCSNLRLLRRKAEDIHRVALERGYKLEEKDRAPMTLFWAFRKRKEWGFIRDYKSAPRWTLWKEYLGCEDYRPFETEATISSMKR